MTIISVQAVGRRYADRLLFSEVSFRLAQGDRAGLVGPNGCGKSSLLRIAAGGDEPDMGAVAVARGARIGFLRQELLFETEGTVADHARAAAAHIRELEAELRELEAGLAHADPAELAHYSDVQHRFEHAGGYDVDATVSRVLSGLSLDSLVDREVSTLSGGERTRLGLARLLLDDPDVLLLDEPTNHLDLAALEWLEKFLVERESTVLVSSHDRWFLDKVTSRTLSFENSTVIEYRGGYSRYVRQRAEREEQQGRLAARQTQEIARQQRFIDQHRADQLSKQSRGRAKQLAKLERIEAPTSAPHHGWRLEASHLAGDTVLEATALRVGHGERTVVSTPALRVGRGASIAVAGANGAGKTTLVRTLVGQLPPLEGFVSSAPTARFGFLAQAQLELTGDETVIDALRSYSGLSEQDARNLLARFLFRGDDVFRSVGVLSGGERSRLALARLTTRDANLLVLDEPTNHLDVAARDALERVLADYNGTLIFVSHDRYFIDRLATEVWMVEAESLRRYEGNWSALRRGDAREIPAHSVARPGAPPRKSASKGPGEVEGGAARVGPPKPSQDGGVPPVQAPAPRLAGALGGPVARLAGDGAAPVARPHSRRKASAVRKVSPARALEVRIESMELQLKQLQKQVEEIARSGNYMETRRIGEEHAALETTLRELYEQWTAHSEKEE